MVGFVGAFGGVWGGWMDGWDGRGGEEGGGDVLLGFERGTGVGRAVAGGVCRGKSIGE